MTEVDFGSLVVVAIASFAVPLLLAVAPGPRIRASWGRVVTGIALGAGVGLIDPHGVEPARRPSGAFAAASRCC